MIDCGPLSVPPATRPPARGLLANAVATRSGEQPPLPFDASPLPAVIDDSVSPEVRRVARAIAGALAEVLQGRRPVGQIETFADGEVLATIIHLARSRAGHGLTLRSLRVQSPAPQVAEVAFQVGEAGRLRAGALRLERVRGRWRCVALEIALTGSGVTRCSAA